MKIEKRNAIFGEELGNILATGHLNHKTAATEVSEKTFAPNIYKIDDLETRDRCIFKYTQALSSHIKEQNQYASTCKRLLKRWEEESENHPDSIQKPVEKKTNNLFSKIKKKSDILQPKSSRYSLEDMKKIEKLYKSVLSGKAAIPQENIDWIQQQARPLDSIKTLASDEKALNTELQTIKQYSKKIAADSKLPYDRITANLVAFPEQKYIMTACPSTAEEQAQFWEMTHKYNASTIVAVLIPNEKGVDHELEYCLPTHFPNNLPSGWTISNCTKEIIAKSTISGLKNCQIAKRIFYFKHNETGTEKTITHFHYEDWPNKKAAPDQALFNAMVEEVEKVHQDKENPIVVHCAVGRGRSGAFVTAHVAKRQIDAIDAGSAKTSTLNIADILMKGRLQRDGFVETKDQMRTIYDASAHFLAQRSS